jgi:hemerythrin-like domain-containing protein
MTDILDLARLPDTHEMVVIHRAFRRESRLLGELIAAVPDGETRRATLLARHLAWYQAGLTNHHHGEDELLWPLLHERAGVDEAIVTRMERQHVRVADTLARAMATLPAWQVSATSDLRDELVRALSFHCRVLVEHLDDEESRLLPLAATCLSSPEWAALGEHFVATTPKAQLLIFLGAVLEEATAEERTALLGAMPRVARFAWRSVGRHQYASYIRRVRGTATDEARQLSTINIRKV